MEEVRNLDQLLELLRRKYKNEKNRNTHNEILRVHHKADRREQHFCLLLAGHTVAVDSLYPEVYRLCKEYETSLLPEIKISITERDLETENDYFSREKINYSESYRETLAVLRRISEEMLSFDTFLMHGAVVAVNNKAYMFTAESGIGKTTHIKKWLESIEGAYVVNGDKPFISIVGSSVYACGTPWCGKENMGTNSIVPLQAIVFMERSEENSIERIPFSQAFIPLMKQVYRPKDDEKMKKTLSLLRQLEDKILFYHYKCNNLRNEAFGVTYRKLIKENDEANR